MILLDWWMYRSGEVCMYSFRKKLMEQAAWNLFNHPRVGDKLAALATPLFFLGLYIHTYRCLRYNTK